MYVTPTQLTELVRSREDAEVVIAELVSRFATPTASSRLTDDAVTSKQSAQEVARRAASNLLTSFTVRRFDASW